MALNLSQQRWQIPSARSASFSLAATAGMGSDGVPHLPCSTSESFLTHALGSHYQSDDNGEKEIRSSLLYYKVKFTHWSTVL